MAKVKQPYAETRYVPWLGREVPAGETVDVSDGDLPGFLEASWEPADAATKRTGKQLLDDGQITVLAGVTDKDSAPPSDDQGPGGAAAGAKE